MIMADEISRVEYYVAAVPHKAGEGARVLTVFKEAGVNLTGLLAAVLTVGTSLVTPFWIGK
jgi:hypothetical protein